MKRMTLLSLVMSFVALVSTALFFSPVAHADNLAGYDIEVQMLYCIDQHKPCNTPATIKNSLYIQVEAVSFHTGTTKVVGQGKMECNSYGKYVKASFASGPFFEGVLGNTDND